MSIYIHTYALINGSEEDNKFLQFVYTSIHITIVVTSHLGTKSEMWSKTCTWIKLCVSPHSQESIGYIHLVKANKYKHV